MHHPLPIIIILYSLVNGSNGNVIVQALDDWLELFTQISLSVIQTFLLFKRMTTQFEYPNNVRHEDQFQEVDYHGTKVLEKYKWLEDPHSEEVKVCFSCIDIFSHY